MTADPSAKELIRRGLAQRAVGELDAAVESFQAAIALDPQHTEAQKALGVTLRQLGRSQVALACYDAALAIDPTDAAAYVNRGNVLLDLGRPEEAVASFERAVSLRPDLAVMHNNLGNGLLRLGRPDSALVSFEAALERQPDYAGAHYNRGVALAALERHAEALASFEAALAADPSFAAAHNNRGAALLELGRAQEAVEAYRAAVALSPQDPQLHNNLGDALLRAGEADAALASWRTAMSLAPDSAEAHWTFSRRLLSIGRYAEGWAEYEHRWRLDHFLEESAGEVTPELRRFVDPSVEVADLAGRRVLAVAEQGVGDVIMFASILPDLQRTAGEVTLLCERRLQRLFSHSFPGVKVIETRQARRDPPPFDRLVPLGSLGRLYRNRVEDFPGAPYLSAPPAVRDRWNERLGAKARLRVGLSWRGGAPHTRRDERSLPLAALRNLLELDGCDFVSLQYQPDMAEIAAVNAALPRPMKVVPPEEIDDFEDLAGLVQALDVVVSVQTTLVHLCGAIGAPCLVLLPPQAEWRYAAQPVTMPWYRSVRLLRAERKGRWETAIGQVKDALRERRDG